MKKLFVDVADSDKAREVYTRFKRLAIDKGFDFDDKAPDIVISIGGDGQMIKTIRQHKHFSVPFAGINAGRLGFLPNVCKDDDCINRFLTAVSSGEYQLKLRPLLRVSAKNADDVIFENFAFNEVIVKYSSIKLMRTDIYIDDVHFNHYTGDGIVVSTPLGSTGYAIWAGAAVINADLPLYQLTPINPNNSSINNPLLYPLVISEEQRLSFKLDNAFLSEVVVGYDGRSFIDKDVKTVDISVSDERVKILEWHDYNYWQVFKSKILDKRKEL